MTFDKINKEVLSGILTDLGIGVLETDVGQMHGIGQATYFRWKKEIPEFKDAVESAVLAYKKRLIQSVNSNTLRSGRTGQEELRRRFPKDFNVPTKIDHSGRVETNIEDLTSALQKIITGEEPKKVDDGHTKEKTGDIQGNK